MEDKSLLLNKLEKFISKYYKNLLIRGAIYFVASFLLFFILLSVLEYFGQFGTLVRTMMFWVFVLVNISILWKWILTPIKGLYRIGNSLSYEDAAKIIGTHFSEVQDKLINVLQLQKLSQQDNELVLASIKQKTGDLSPFRFSNAINFQENKKYLKYALVPIVLLLVLFFSGNKKIVIESSSRILSHAQEFTPKAPFSFVIDNNELTALKGEDFLLKMHFEGEQSPSTASIIAAGNQYNMRSLGDGSFSFLFKNPQQSLNIQMLADGFYSPASTLKVVPRPFIKEFKVSLRYPDYINRTQESFDNKGNLKIPNGSRVQWEVKTAHSSSLYYQFEDGKEAAKKTQVNAFQFSIQALKNISYGLFTENEFLKGDSIFYQIQVTPDAFPSISLIENVDSVNTLVRFLSGEIEDDYGLKKLTLNYRFLNDSSKWLIEDIDINKKISRQSYAILFDLQERGLPSGEGVEYFVEVWDNDGVNGSKSTRSTTNTFRAPSSSEMQEIVDGNSDELKDKIKKSKELAEDLQKDMEELRKQLLEEKDLNWEDKQKAKDLLEKQQELKKQINDIEKLQAQNKQQENQISKPNSDLLKKQEEIQKLMQNIMDDEMKDLMKELENMMDDVDKEELKDMLEEMQQNDEDVEKELDRTLEILKQMELEQKLEKNANDLLDLAEKQKALAEKTKEKNQNTEDLKKEQEKIQKEFKDIQEDLKKAQELNQELENKMDLADTKSKEEEIKEDMKKSAEQLDKQQKKQSSKSQKEAAKKMEEMSEQIQSAMASEESESVAEDIETLRQILENLITISLEQENLLANIESIKSNSPLYSEFMRTQKKLEIDAQIIEDSLFALSKRQPKIESFINTEINALNTSMSKALTYMAERKSAKASERQQFAMTASNNLALLLSEILEEMQKKKKKNDNKPSSKMCNKPKSTGGESMKKMKKMQKELKEKMKKMAKGKQGQKGQKTGGKQSKEIAKMAAQQEMIRKRMSEIKDEIVGDKETGNIDKMIKEMEQTEVDIINNNITRKTLLRQETIMSRLLEAEKAEMERDKDKERESQEWINNLSKRLVNPFSEYQEEKKKQEELIRTIPPSLSPFYKNKVNQYFKNARP